MGILYLNSDRVFFQNLASEFKREAANSICKAISKHVECAQNLKESKNAYWWKLFESCLMAINSFKEVIEELSAKNALEFDLNAFINQVVISSLYETSTKQVSNHDQPILNLLVNTFCQIIRSWSVAPFT